MEGEQGLESELFPGVGKEPPNSVTPESSRPSAAYLPRGGRSPAFLPGSPSKPVVLKVWSLDQWQQHHLGTC